MVVARPFPIVPLVLAAVVAFAAAFGIGLAAKKSSSSPTAPARAPVVALPSQAPKVAALTAPGALPALRVAPHKHKAPATTTAPATQSTPTQSAPVQSAPVQAAPQTQPKTTAPKTGGGVVGGGSQ
jgi:hypothetical protein